MPTENGTAYWRQILRFVWLTQTKYYQKRPKKFWNETSDEDISIKRRLSDGIDRNWHFWAWNINFWFYQKGSDYNQEKWILLYNWI